MNMLVKKTKLQIQSILGRFGYEIHKKRAQVTPVNLFPWVMWDLIRRTGEDQFFIQVGAHDGLHYDPIRPWVEKFHWSGVLAEPQPIIFKRLVENYKNEPQLKFENVAIGKEN